MLLCCYVVLWGSVVFCVMRLLSCSLVIVFLSSCDCVLCLCGVVLFRYGLHSLYYCVLFAYVLPDVAYFIVALCY